jgi:hypothetical protein
MVGLELVAERAEGGGHRHAGMSDDDGRAFAALLPVELYLVR